MEKSRLKFIVSFFYAVYFISILNEAYITGISQFLINSNSYFITFGFILFGLILISKKTISTRIRSETIKKLLHEDYYIFFNALFLSHIIYFFRLFEKTNIAISNSFSINPDFLSYVFYFIAFSLIAFSIPKINKRRLLILTSVIFFLQILYHSIFFISFGNQASIYRDTYVALAKNGIKAQECGETIDCDKIMFKDLSKVIPLITNSLPQDKNGDSIRKYFINFENKINNSDNETVTFSYTDAPWKFSTNEYKPIGVYNKKTGLLIIDTKSNQSIYEYHSKIRQQLTGSSILIWCLFSFFLIILHGRVKLHYAKK